MKKTRLFSYYLIINSFKSSNELNLLVVVLFLITNSLEFEVFLGMDFFTLNDELFLFVTLSVGFLLFNKNFKYLFPDFISSLTNEFVTSFNS